MAHNNGVICPLCCQVFFVMGILLFGAPPLDCSVSSDCAEIKMLVYNSDDDNSTTITSPASKFELGFFNRDESFTSSNNKTYLGIWYKDSNPKIVVWVANRDNPLSEPSGYLVVEQGHAKLLGNYSLKIYWSANYVGSKDTNATTLCLSDNGNLMVIDNSQRDALKSPILWQSFDHPTDTYLPGMNAGGSLKLTSWRTSNNPASGDFTLLVNSYMISLVRTGSPYFSEDGVIISNETEVQIQGFLLANPSESMYNNARLVINSTGEIQQWEKNTISGWFLTLHKPEDSCNQIACNFGSCNRYTGYSCRSLPGYVQQENQENSEGCLPKSNVCKRQYFQDVFLRMPMIQVKLLQYHVTNENEDCETLCRKECRCVAYTCGDVNCTGISSSDEKRCYRWYDKLPVLHEEHPEGFTVFVRTTNDNIELTSKDCTPCGSYIIPYPLSTAIYCGDRSYYDFQCNTTTGLVGFLTSSGTFRVASIDPDSRKFYIHIRHTNSCDSIYRRTHILSPKQTSQYNITNCNVGTDQLFPEFEQSYIAVEIEWKPPPEPACKAPTDCHDWAHTTCKETKGGVMRCKCGSKFRWDDQSLKCTRERTPLHLKVVLASVAGGLALVLFIGVFYIHHSRRSTTRAKRSDKFEGDNTEGFSVPYFDWESVLAATNNFANENKLGKGGFGLVYKGTLPDGKEVAVKRLSSVSVQGIEEFRTEVVLIAKLQHRNLVRLLGYSIESNEKILLYEFMPNGSLDSCLFDETHSVFLDWEKRFDIIFGIARGLLYLHQDSRFRIIHRDLKPSNILLDEEMNAKISDFGIARIIGGKDTEGSTKRVVGTYGYMSPEYAYEGLFSIKSDVFSFGVVVLEIISGRRNSKLFQIEFGTSLPGQAWKLWNEERGLDLMDQTLKETCNPSQVMKCIHLGLLCVQEEPSDRPTMSNVVLKLSSDNASLPYPKQPAFSTRKPPSETASSSSIKNPSFSDVITSSTVGR